MITITRRQARCLRGVFRRSALGIAHRGPIPPLVLRTGGTQLRAHYRYAGLAIEHAGPDGPFPAEAIALPLDALAECEGRDGAPVVLEAVAPDRTIVRWHDHGVPQAREFAVPAPDTLAPFPGPPASWANVAPELFSALAEASATATDDNARYALGCLLLRGRGEIVGTDGRQLLVLGGFRFPWTGDVLIRRAPLFASRELPRDRPLSVGKTDTHVVLRAGPWTVFSEIQTDARFPEVDRALPDAGSVTTRLRLDPEDALFLAQALAKLPGADELNAPATVDLNGRVAIRAGSSDQSQRVELILAHSRFTGPPVRLNSNREFLGRALGLGFTEIAIADADTPVVCRDRNRVYGWQPLSQESALGPTDDVTRIESGPSLSPPAIRRDAPPKARRLVSERIKPTRSHPSSTGAADGQAITESPGPVGLSALIQEAEALHVALSDARARAGRLIVALRRHRKRERLVSTTLASLKALKFQEVSE